MRREKDAPNSLFQPLVIVSAMGFFVDVYDLLLFGILRKPSLGELGLRGEEILRVGEWLISVQMIGLLVGGILWGVLGDKKGRLSVLLGSILVYSIANLLNATVHEIWTYTLFRFLAGIGLAGELGAGITLVSERMDKERRGIASAMIAGFGILGAVSAYFMKEWFSWRACYLIGGLLGLGLLALRFRIKESNLFQSLRSTTVERGNFWMFFKSRRRLSLYLRCILVGLPAWFIIGVLATFADRFGEAFGTPNIDPGRAIMFLYLAIAFGDLSVGLLSNYFRSRKKALFLFYGICVFFGILFFTQQGNGPSYFYGICAGLGYGAGFSVVYITMSAEQFGTNLRATAAVTIPNMVRGALPIILIAFRLMRQVFGSYIIGAWITGALFMAMAIAAAWSLPETFGRDLDYLESDEG